MARSSAMASVPDIAAHPLQASIPTKPVDEDRRRSAANRLLDMAWTKGWLALPPLDPDELVAIACRAGKVDRLHDGCWRERLNVLASALIDEASLNPLGRVMAYGQITAALLNRARLQTLWGRHPEIGRLMLSPPILIVGQMRSGTTRMQRLLACDPRLTFTRFYESWNPLPRFSGFPRADRAARAWVALRFAHFFNPDFRRIHPTGVYQAEEEMGLQNISIFGAAFEAQWRVPSFAACVEKADPTTAYAEFKRLLQTIAWLRGAEPAKPWVLKLPQFTQDLDTVLSAFPGARVVRLHRDPVPSVASAASLVCNQMRLQSDAMDPVWIGREWLRKTALRQRRMDAALANATAPVVDVDYDAMEADWRGEMLRIYTFLGVPFSRKVECRMNRLVKAHEKRPRHEYDLERYGLSRHAIMRALAVPPSDGHLPDPGTGNLAAPA